VSVYFVTCREIDMVKIGYAFNPVARFNHLRTSCPLELALEGAIPGGFEKERELHGRYAKWRVRGEWFQIVPSIEAEIDASTVPTEFTWGAVKLWIKKLEEETLAAEPPRPRFPREDVVPTRSIDEAHMYGWGRHDIKKLIAAGDIYFPFRQLEEAD
jgi:hypothetical protein